MEQWLAESQKRDTLAGQLQVRRPSFLLVSEAPQLRYIALRFGRQPSPDLSHM